MIVKYKCVLEKHKIEVNGNSEPLSIDGVQVVFCIKHNILLSFSVAVPQVKIREAENGWIESSYPDARDKAYGVALYIINNIYFETGTDLIDALAEWGESCDLIDENTDEADLLKKTRMISKNLRVSWNILGAYKFIDLENKFSHEKAKALYADAMRAANPFSRYILFYSVVDYYFSKYEGKDFDKEVSAYAIQHDSRFNENMVASLREIRIGCVHPNPKKVEPLSPSKISNVKSVEEKLPDIQKLARLLLEHHLGSMAE